MKKGLRAAKMNGKTEFLKRFVRSFVRSVREALKTASLRIGVNYFFCSSANGVFTRTCRAERFNDSKMNIIAHFARR